MHVSVLASGSKGNSTFVEINNTRLLIDAGISARRVSKSLEQLGVDIKGLDGIIITHEHRDHISGLPMLCKKYGLPLYSREDTFKAMYCLKDLPLECINPIEQNFCIGGLSIDAFSTSHDAADSVGYSLHGKKEKCTLVTDLGFVTSTVQEAIDGSDVLILEANHDQKMLRSGSYPQSLKQRILGKFGHLSNNDAAWALARMKKNNPYVFLAHMSEENNCPSVMKETITQIIENQGIKPGRDLTLCLAKQNEMVSLPADR